MIILEGTKDQYIPVRKISDGGEATIYLCENGKGERFAGKLYRTDRGLNKYVRRFLAEQTSLCFMKLVDQGIAALEGGNRAFEIYEFLEGECLTEMAPMKAELLVGLVIPRLNEALHRLHRMGFLHRDIKPDNLYVRMKAGVGELIAAEENSAVVGNPAASEGITAVGNPAASEELAAAGNPAASEGLAAAENSTRDKILNAKKNSAVSDHNTCYDTIVLGDFGLCVPADPEGFYCDAGVAYTPGYVPSEVLGSGTYSAASDYYAMGVSLYYLLTGHQIFEGMNPDEIMVRTKKGELASLDGIDKRMASLIEGLTIQDPRYRFGYTEVLEWISGADVPVFHFTGGGQALNPPYQFSAKLSLQNTSELANVIRIYPEEGKKQLYDGFMGETLGKQYPYLGSSLREIVQERFPHARNAGLAACLPLLDPEDSTFFFDGQAYKELALLTEKVSSELSQGTISASTEELLSSGILSYYYKKELSGEELDRLKQIEKHSVNRPLPASASFVVSFAKRPYYQPEEGVRCERPEDYVAYLGQCQGNVGSLIYRDFNRNYFEVWLEQIGLGKAFEAWKKHFYQGNLVPEDEYIIGNACQFLEEVSSEGTGVLRHFVLAEAERSPEYWVLTHRDLYKADEMMEQMINENFESTALDESMNVPHLLKKRHEMWEYMNELRRDFLNNPSLYASNIYDASDYRIVSDDPAAYFVKNGKFEMVPLGWLMEFGTLLNRNQAKKQYELFTDQAKMYTEKLEKRVRDMADEVEETCQTMRKTRRAPGLSSGICALLVSTLCYVVWWLFSNRFMSGAGIITIAGFAMAFVFNTMFFIAGLIRLNLCRQWNRVLKGCANLRSIADSIKQRTLLMEQEKERLHLVENGRLYHDGEEKEIEGLTVMKGNPEMEAMEEHARLSYLTKVKKLKNGLWRYMALFVLAAILLTGGLYLDGSIEFTASFWKKEISSLLEDADPSGWFSSGGAKGEEQENTTRIVSVSKARLRSGPGTSFDVLNSYKKGTVVELTGNSQSDGSYIWYEVMAEDGIVGWMRADTVKEE